MLTSFFDTHVRCDCKKPTHHPWKQISVCFNMDVFVRAYSHPWKLISYGMLCGKLEGKCRHAGHVEFYGVLESKF